MRKSLACLKTPNPSPQIHLSRQQAHSTVYASSEQKHTLVICRPLWSSMSASLTTSGGCLARRVTSSYCVASRTRKISSLAAKSNPHRVRPCISAQYPHKCRNIPAAVSGQVYMTLHVSRCNSTLAARKTDKHRVFVAFGSNIGDRINMIEQACRLLQKHDDIKILRTSSLWETKAMYVVDQADFLNGACEVGTYAGHPE